MMDASSSTASETRKTFSQRSARSRESESGRRNTLRCVRSANPTRSPQAILLVIGGLLISFIPGIPRVSLNPDLVFLAVLPPLLYHAAWLTSWREFSYHLVSIVLLAFGLVAFTVFGVTQAGHWLLPGFDWRVGLVLGAVVAPTDAI